MFCPQFFILIFLWALFYAIIIMTLISGLDTTAKITAKIGYTSEFTNPWKKD